MILNLISGGGSNAAGAGGTLQVNAPANVTVTVAKDSESYTQTANDQGIAVFHGLTTGLWAVTITNGVQTSEPLAVQIVTDFACYISFFAATISVEYPVNCICTCAKDGIVLTAPDQSGSAIFTVSESGAWVVSCVDASGENPLQKTATISTSGETVRVGLHYDTYIFDAKPVSDEITGGWHSLAIKRDAAYNGNAIAPMTTQNTDYLQISFSFGSTQKSGIYKTVNKIDLTDVRAIEFTGILKTTATTELSTKASMVCWSELGNYWNMNVVARISTADYNNVKGTYQLNVSHLTGPHYVGFALDSYNSNVSLYKVELLY